MLNECNRPRHGAHSSSSRAGSAASSSPASPLQLAVVASQIAERGHAFKPHVLKAYRDSQTGATQAVTPQALPPIQLKDQRHWDTVINAMRGVISDPRGTAHHYVGMNPKYPIAGKSGSAQVAGLPQNEVAPDLASIPYKLREHALFIAFAPVDDPKIAVGVLVEHGGGGSSVAGPIARDVIDSYLDSQQGETRGPVTAQTAATGAAENS